MTFKVKRLQLLNLTDYIHEHGLSRTITCQGFWRNLKSYKILFMCEKCLRTKFIFEAASAIFLFCSCSILPFLYVRTECAATPRAARLVLWHFLGGEWGRICPKWFCSQRRATGRRWRPGRFCRAAHFPSVPSTGNSFKMTVWVFFVV